MNRIYQGKVTKVEIFTDGKPEPLDNWQDALWQHHQLFQDAVNYYIVCLLALATDPGSETAKLRQRITKEGDEAYVWGRFRRRGVWRRGLRDSVVPYLTPGSQEPTFEQVAAAVLAGSGASTELRHLALEELLFVCSGDNPIKNQGRWMFDRFCNPDYTGSFPFDASADLRGKGASRLTTELHALSTQAELDAFAEKVEIGWVVNLTKGTEPFSGDKARERLLKAVSHFQQVFGVKADTEMGNRVAAFLAGYTEAEKELANFVRHITAMAVDKLPSIPANNRSIPDRLEACILFKHFPNRFTAELLKVSFPKADETAIEKPRVKKEAATRFTKFGGDAIELTRGQRGFVFHAFTSLPVWGGNGDGKPRWLTFDVVAFKEALKALHQVDDKGADRQKELAQKQVQHEYQRGKTKKWKGTGSNEEEQRPPVLAGDPRIQRLEELLRTDLADEYEMSEGQPVKYGLQARTIRGFRDLRKKWNKSPLVNAGYSEAARKQLLEKLHEYQKDNAETVGSVRLFAELLNESNWLIWREPTAEQQREWRQTASLPDDAEFSKDPLQALTDERELLEEIERLKKPIRLTPADSEHSRRQFYFSDVAKFTERGEYGHKPNQRAVIVPMAVQEDRLWRQVRIRLHYSAPRLLREGLRADRGENLSAMPWLQPMMAALGLPEPLPQDFRDCPVALMPDVAASGERRILLNFPLTLDEQRLLQQLGKVARWDVFQFGGADSESYWLRWPTTWLKEKPDRKKPLPQPWWESGVPFRCLSVDLGQRDAGAFALLEVTCGDPPKPQSRKVGEANGKAWWATVRATGLLRLPGEDAMVLREGKWQEELSGERGRIASREEWDEACDICMKLGLDRAQILGEDPKRHSFPELNNELLYALRRAQARLARLQSWSCIAVDEKRRKRIAEEITEVENDPLALKLLVAKQAWDLIAAKLITELEKDRAAIQRELVRIADRIQPLRGRRWEWVKRDDGSGCYILRQTNPGTDPRPKLLAGQRGLSIERIEQLESLRQRCQSLNRALMQTPGQPAKLGRSKRGIELPDPCPELLDRLDNLKEQRVNQTAHLILAQALGVRLRPHSTNTSTRQKRDIHGEYELIPGRQPVDFLVLENLDRYLASQGRSRSENSRLMKWCHRQILGKLKQLGEPYGLRVLETPAAYSSRFCSLTGVAGFRAVELTPDNRQDFRWRKHLERLADRERAKKLSREEREESRQVKALFDALDHLNADLLANRPARPKWRTLLAPAAGGPLFVPMRGKVQQADINAAINLGLRAIAAPEAGDIHVRIRSERKGEKFFVRAENLREKARWGATPPEIFIPDGKSRAELLTEARPNFFADLVRVANFDRAEVSGQSGFASGRGLWGTINQHDWLRINTLNNERLGKARLGHPLKEEDLLP